MKYRIVTHNGKYRIQKFVPDDSVIPEDCTVETPKKWEFVKTLYVSTLGLTSYESVFETDDLGEAKAELANVLQEQERKDTMAAHESGPWEVVE